MLKVLQAVEANKKPGRPSNLALEEQLLLTPSPWRGYRTPFRIALSYGVHETAVTRTLNKVEDALNRFRPPQLAEEAVAHDFRA